LGERHGCERRQGENQEIFAHHVPYIFDNREISTGLR
jgi:hypothetical protein